jgi:hypothetical protein
MNAMQALGRRIAAQWEVAAEMFAREIACFARSKPLDHHEQQHGESTYALGAWQ